MMDDLFGIYAYDTGCVDSGIHDEMRRAELKLILKVTPITYLSKVVREHFLSDEALDKGYTLEDVASFIRWLNEHMDFNL